MTFAQPVARVRAAQPVVLLTGLALVAGYLSVRQPHVALFLPMLPIALFCLLRPQWAVAAAIGLLPILRSLLGSEGGSANVTPSDAVFLLAAGGLFPLLLLDEAWQERLKRCRPLVLAAVPYMAWLLVVLAAHFSGHSAFKTMTALEISVFPMVLGATVMTPKLATWAFRGFLVSAGFLALLWAGRVSSSFAGNKNAAGQYLALAMLMTIVLSRGQLRRFAPLPLYFAGLLFASSRGALVALAFGAITLLGLRGLGSWRRTATTVVILSAVVLIGYNAVPASVQDRVQAIFTSSADTKGTNARLQTDDQSSTAYNLKIRASYRKDAYQLIRDNPLLGVGTGNYLTGTGPTLTVDPHNALLRLGGEGGLPNIGAFLFLVGSTTLLLVRRLKRSVWAGAAIAIQVAAFTHGMVDVYFVRGIPVLGWLLVGMALNPAFDRAQDTREPDEERAVLAGV